MTIDSFFEELAQYVLLPEGIDQLKKLRELAAASNWNAWPALVWFIRGMKASGGIEGGKADKLISQAADTANKLKQKRISNRANRKEKRNARKIPFSQKRVDPRAFSNDPMPVTPPLPYICRESLKKVKHALPIPSNCHCGGKVELVSELEVYGRNYSSWPYAYVCRSCAARVGLHPNTDLPLGFLCGPETRQARVKCKESFERIWTARLKTRNEAYKWLSREMNIPPHRCHIGMFDISQCEEAKRICDELLARYSK